MGRGGRKFRYIAAVGVIVAGLFQVNLVKPPVAQAYTPTHVAGQDYKICDLQAQYLTSPWSYHSLASGSQSYTVAQYEALTGYGTTLPPLPAYIAAEDPTTEAAIIFAPGSTANGPAYNYPETPLMYFFEGGAYGSLGFDTVSGDEFIGGSAPGFPEPQFDDANNAAGINGQNGSHYFSGGSSMLSANASSGSNTVTTTSAIPGYINWMTFADGATYQITNVVGTTITLGSNLTANESSGSPVWANQDAPLSELSAPAAQGATSVTLKAATIPMVQYGNVYIGDHVYGINSVSGTQSGYTLGTGPLDIAAPANTPIYYSDNSGGVTVSYLDIAHDSHNTTGTIYTGAGWTITHNNIHDGYMNGSGVGTPGLGVAIYGGDQGTIEYNCLSKMGDYGINVFGTNNKFDYNEVYESNYEPDPGCGCSGGGKWWGTLNADIVDNAFVKDSPAGGVPIWLDNGNTGTNISGNLFDTSWGGSVESETGFNLSVTGNLFVNGGWGDGIGCGDSNCVGQVNLNSSGGFHVPGSRYDNQVTVSGNQFVNDWGGLDIWQAGGRSCENSGEGWPDDAGYCSGGYPISSSTAAGGQYFFSHIGDTAHGFTTQVDGAASAGSSTVLVQGSLATDDQIGFADPIKITTTDTTDVSTFSGSGTVNVSSTTGFPSSGQLRVGTSAAWDDGNGSWTGAILSYTGTTPTSFTGVSLVRGTGTLAGALQQVQPYKVTGETCYANDCAVSITPSLTSPVAVGDTVTNAGTCQLFATAASLPSGPLAPNGTSYWDGCQWEAQRIAISSNTFSVQPSQINDGTPINGGGKVGTHKNNSTGSFGCTLANDCGTNFMADQYNSGEAPFTTEIGPNAMMSNSALTGCPSWDPGCTTNPLTNLNAGASPPGAPAGNGEAAGNDVWSGNTFLGPWNFNDYIYGNCAGGGVFMPSDSVTGHSLDSTSCQVNFAGWQADWQQDAGSSYSGMAVSLSGLASGQEVYSNAQNVTAYEDTDTAGNITSHLKVGGATDQTATVSTSPHSFTLNTLNYPDGQYTLAVDGTDTGAHTNSDSVLVWISNGDLNGDGIVNISDLAVMAGYWLQSDPSYGHGNITGQGTINLSDLAVLAANWGWSHP